MATWSHDITSPSPCPEVTVTAVSQNRPPDQDAIRLYICLRMFVCRLELMCWPWYHWLLS